MEMEELFLAKGLSKPVSDLGLCQGELNINIPSSLLFIYIILLNYNMLGSRMELGILYKGNSALIIAIDNYSLYIFRLENLREK